MVLFSPIVILLLILLSLVAFGFSVFSKPTNARLMGLLSATLTALGLLLVNFGYGFNFFPQIDDSPFPQLIIIFVLAVLIIGVFVVCVSGAVRLYGIVPKMIGTFVDAVQYCDRLIVEYLRNRAAIDAFTERTHLTRPRAADKFNIVLRIRRTHRFTLIMRRPKFILQFKAEVSPEEIALIRKYKMWNSHLYTSEEFKQRFERSVTPPTITGLLAVPIMLMWSVLTFFSFKMTVRSVVKGKRVERRDLGDLVTLEREVIEAANTLKHYLQLARSFDGRTETIEI